MHAFRQRRVVRGQQVVEVTRPLEAVLRFEDTAERWHSHASLARSHGFGADTGHTIGVHLQRDQEATLFPSQTKNLDFRRKWDKDEYEKLAEKRLTEEREKKDGKPAQPVKRELLRHRDYKVDLESKLGKTIVITKTTPQSEMGGYYCNVCDCVVKDSINFLDHINGKKHQRNLGMSMRVERSTLDQVKKRFEVNKKKMEEKQKDYDFEERMKELREEEEKAKAYKKEKQREKKRRAEEDLTFEEDDEMAAVMGFSGFGSTKKSH
ncbi:zinc finger matrin-type protein 2 [Serinus canaria]|nr:zinc finger matrin-type protein 2 [Serinus canaria]